jgi:uncharacterized membrane protein YoaT (DUF817 family)
LTLQSLSVPPALSEALLFVLKQVRACVFAGVFFTILWASRRLPLYGLPRYDFIFLAVLLAQGALLLLRIETRDEARTLCLFHVVGLALELFKTHPAIGSWSYPEAGYLKIATVPLYSGFMYAGVASYMCQAWHLFDLGLRDYPSYRRSVPLGAAIYLNFFTHHFIGDARGPLTLGVLAVFWKTKVDFTVRHRRRSMPLVLAFFLIGFFIWVAENVSTRLGAWAYPEQLHAWTPVAFGKISSWFLLVIISFILVADLKHVREARRQGEERRERSEGRNPFEPQDHPIYEEPLPREVAAESA